MKEPRETRTLANVVSLAICGILAGVVVAAAAFPVVGVSGLSAKSASDSFNDLPAAIKIPPLPQKSVLKASDGTTPLAIFYDENREPVQLAQVAPVMQQAMVAAEDNRFYLHRGVDARGIIRAFVHNQSDGSQQGASTLTQQYVRAILTYSAGTNKELKRAATEDTAGRKLREIRYAIALEKQLSKKQILQNYLNTIYFGQNSYGIRAAAWSYFGKMPSALTLPEAAMIAGLAQNPNKYDPVANGPKDALVRREYVLNGMVKLHYITQAQADAANQSPIVLNHKTQKQSCENGYAAYGFFCGFFLDWWKADPAFGANSSDRLLNLQKGGYTIISSIDPQMQKAAQKAIDEQTDANTRFALGTVMIEPGTGRVKAMAINRKYGITKNPQDKAYPNTVNPLLSGSDISPGYQAGSTFKMFTMLAALKKGIPLSHTIFSQERYTSQYLGACKTGGNHYCPKNASKSMTGLQTMSSAFGESANTYFVPLEEEVSVKSAIAAAEAAGVQFRGSRDQENKKAAQTDPNAWGSFTLGTAQVTPLDMATAYATVAARGKHCDPLPVKSIIDQDGKPLAAANPTCNQAFPQAVADAAADAARCPVADGSSVGISCTHPGGGDTAASVGRAIDRPVAGKTGTTDDNNASWFAGFTPNLAIASFLANPEKYDDTVPNSQWAINAARNALAAALQDVPKKQFVPPPSLLAFGIRANVPDVVGNPVDAAQSQLRASGFNVRVDPKPIDSTQLAGVVAKTDPSGGSTTSRGSSVTIYTSTGKPPAAGGPQPPLTEQQQQICRTFQNLPMCQGRGGG